MAKTKLEKHLEELGEQTSGNSKDAVTFAGRGLDLLKSMIGLSKSKGGAGEEEVDEDPEDPADTNEDQEGPDMKKSANGGELSEADEDPEDPAQAGDDAKGGSIITNKGKKISKDSSPAVKKSMAEYDFDEKAFSKSFEERYEDVLDASDAVADLAKSVKGIGSAQNATTALIKSVMDQNVVLAKAVGELLKSNASIAAELEGIKHQPVSNPSPGYVVMSKKADNSDAQGSKALRKSDIQDSLTDLMNEGLPEAGQLLKKLGVLHSNEEVKDFYDNLPDEVREKI